MGRWKRKTERNTLEIRAGVGMTGKEKTTFLQGPGGGQHGAVWLVCGGREVHTEGKRDLSPRDRPPSQVCYPLDLQHWIILSLCFPLCERDSSNTCFFGGFFLAGGCCNNQMKGKGLAHCVHRCLALFLRGHLWDQFWLGWGTPSLLNASIVRTLLPLIQLHVIPTMFPMFGFRVSATHMIMTVMFMVFDCHSSIKSSKMCRLVLLKNLHSDFPYNWY